MTHDGEPWHLPGFEPVEPAATRRPARQRPATPGPATPEPMMPAPADAGDAPVPAIDEVRVEVVRSDRRRRTVGAQVLGGTLRISVPSWMSRAEEAHWIETMTARHRRKMSTDRIDLRARSTELARRYDLPRPREIKWAGDMSSRWGSCTPAAGTIRLSARLARFPDWVIDYVIVHELGHLEEPGHGAAFWRLVNRYPRAERAIGYLIAKSGDADPDDID